MYTSPSHTAYPFLTGGGELGELTCRVDWSQTSIGTPDRWPQSLRTTLSIILNSKFPMFLFWGPEHLCFYNDAYRPSLGVEGKHPGAIGKPGAEVWPETWATIKPLIDQVLAGGEATWSEDQLIPIYRNGKLEDVYWTFSYSPVSDESGSPAGVFVTCTETTQKVATIGQLEASNDELSFAIEAAELGTWDLNPLTNRFTASARLKNWFGIPPDEEIELHTATDVIAPEERSAVVKAIQQAQQYESGGQYDIEYTIVHPHTQQRRVVRARGKAWFTKEQTAYRFNGTLQDVTEQALARQKIEASEQYFRQLTDTVPAILWITEADGNCSYLNQQWYDYTGQTEVEAKGLGWLTATHPDNRADVERLFISANDTQTPFYARYRLLGRDGQYRWVIDKASPRFNAAGEYTGMIGTVVDIHDQKVAEDDATRFKHMAENAGDEFILMREDGTFAYLNKLVLDRWGYTASETGRISVYDAAPLYDNEVFAALFARAKQGETLSLETLHRKKDGQDYPVEVNLSGLVLGGQPHLFAVARDITERKKAEHALRDSESLFRNVTNSAPTGLWLSDQNGGLTYLNNTLVDWSGMSYDALLGPGWANAIVEEDRQRSADVFLAAVATRTHYEVQFRIRKADGSSMWCRAEGDPYDHDDGTFAGYAGFCMDIDELVKQQQALKESEERFQAAVVAVEGVVWTNNALGEMQGTQPGWAALTGQSYADYQGYGWAKAVHPDDAQPMIDAWQVAVQERHTFTFEHRLRLADGTWGLFSVRAIPLLNADGLVREWVGVHTNVTEQALARQKLDESETTLRGAINVAELGTWQIDLLNGVFDYSARLRGWFGFSPDEVITRERAYSPLRTDEVPRVQAAIAQATTPGSPGIYDIEYTVDATRAGRERILHVMGKAFFDQTGKAYKLSGTAQDVTSQRKIQVALEQEVQERTEALAATNEELAAINEEMATTNEELTEANQLLLRSNENLQQFAYVASHDLQEPLRKIQSFGDLLKNRYATELRDGVEHIERMQAAANRMSTLIRDLLAFSRISTQQDTTAPVPLKLVVGNVLTDLDLRIQETGARIDVGILPVIQGDQAQLEQLLQNLLSNALKFRRTGTTPLILVQSQLVAFNNLPPSVKPARQSASYHRIDVTDNGIGFDDKYVDRIFQVFQRLHGKNEFAGTGIGLAICEKVAANHGGAITATSQPGQGATFSVYLPA